MICQGCKVENQAGSKYCRSCGEKLKTTPKMRNKPHYKAIAHCEVMIESLTEDRSRLTKKLNNPADKGMFSNLLGGDDKRVRGEIKIRDIRIKDHQRILAVLNGGAVVVQ